ncbi:class I SAM-dependent methyltransferase [Patescibacteria group bacterium]|nr:class I SAM-dependent methyltransferase [Patescibacteria group bacterium]
MAEQQIQVPGGKELIDARLLLEKAGIAEKMIVADLGCGRRGYFTLQAAKLIGPDGLVYAVDVVKSALENVNSMANLFGIPNIKTVWANLEILRATKIPNESIDLAMINNVFFQTKRDDLIIQEAVRILKKNGKLLITDWKKTQAPFGPPIQDRIGPEQVKRNADRCNLILGKEIEAGPYHYALIFIKN